MIRRAALTVLERIVDFRLERTHGIKKRLARWREPLQGDFADWAGTRSSGSKRSVAVS